MNEYTPTSANRSSLKPVLFAVLASFLLGASLVGYLAWRGYFGMSDGKPAAVQEPRTWRNGAGQPVEQLSPAVAASGG